MKIAALLQKFFRNDPTVLPAPAALAMATTNGAKALGFGTGTLCPGRLPILSLSQPTRHATRRSITPLQIWCMPAAGLPWRPRSATAGC